MKNKNRYKRSAIITLFSGLVILVALNIILSFLYFRIDLTSDKRNSLSPTTIELLKSLPDKIYIKVYLKGRNYPADYQIFAQKTNEILQDFSRISSNIQFEFIDPVDGKSKEESANIYQEFFKKGLPPIPLTHEDFSTSWVIPGAFFTYRGKEYPVTLIETSKKDGSWLDFSTQRLEYNLVVAIRNIIIQKVPKVAFLEGHGELDRLNTSWMEWELSRFYNVERVVIDDKINALRNIYLADSTEQKVGSYGNKFDVLIVAQPTRPFSDMDKYVIDQFIMNGGKVLWLIDATNASVDSLQGKVEFFARENYLRLNSLFFKYGVRVNTNLIQDLSCQSVPLQSGFIGSEPQFKFFAFPYMLNVVHFSTTHPIANKINNLKADFVGTIDFVGPESLSKIVLATTSEKTKTVPTPSIVTLNVIKAKPNLEEFNKMYVPIAVLVEGVFTSAFQGILPPEFDTIKEFNNKKESVFTSQIFISDGDMMRSYFDLKNNQPYPTGYDRYSNKMYDNSDFLMNCINYLSGEEMLINVRTKDFRIGALSSVAVKKNGKFYILLNTVVPIIILLTLAFVLIFIRKWRFNRKIF